MPSSITVTCPECEKSLKASSEVLGKKIRCKACGATFVGRAAGESAPAKKPAAKKDAPKASPVKSAPKPPPVKAPAPAPKPAGADDDEDMTPYGVTHEYIGRRCPNCTEPMEDAQVVCLECGYNTQTRDRARRVKIKDTTGGDVFWWLLPGILCVIAIITLLTLWLLFVFLINEATFGSVEEDVWYGFLGGKGMKIYTGLFALFLIYLCSRFAIKRLIQDNKPPEVEDKSREGDDDEDEDDDD